VGCVLLYYLNTQLCHLDTLPVMSSRYTTYQGTLLPTEPVVPGDGQLAELARTYCSGEDVISELVVRIGAMDALVHRCMVAMIVRVYGSLATHRISGGQLRIIERALGGDHFAWGLMLHAKMMGQLNSC
jgi:hypothetical protein